LGILVVVVGLVLVGASGMLRDAHSNKDDHHSATDALLGTMLILAGSGLNSLQNVFEEKLMKGLGTAEVDPLEVVGWEGVFGTLLSALVMLPIVQAMKGGNCGSVENSSDT